jgi:hypothetical protein
MSSELDARKQAINHIAWMKLKFATNPNRYGLAMWKSIGLPGIQAKDRFEALCGIVIPQFQEVSAIIVRRFNERVNGVQVNGIHLNGIHLNGVEMNAIHATKLHDISSDLITDDDMSIMNTVYDQLEHAVNAQEAMQNLLQAILGSLGKGTSRVDMMTMLINTLTFESKFPGKIKKGMNRDAILEIMLYHPTSEEITSLGLSQDNLNVVEECLS